MYTAVDAEECARIANILSLENAVQAEEIYAQAEENAVQAEKIYVQAEEIYVQADEIAHLRGILETQPLHPLQGNRRVNHEKFLKPMDIVDQPRYGALCSPPPRSHAATPSINVAAFMQA